MKLTEKAIAAIDRRAILELAFALDFTEMWIERLVKANRNNGPLTTVKALNVLEKEIGLSIPEILEQDTIESQR